MDGEADDCLITPEGDLVLLQEDTDDEDEPGHVTVGCVVSVKGKPSMELIAGLHVAMRGLFGAMMSH